MGRVREVSPVGGYVLSVLERICGRARHFVHRECGCSDLKKIQVYPLLLLSLQALTSCYNTL